MADYKLTFVDGKTLTLKNAIIDTDQRVVLVKSFNDGNRNYYDFYPFENIIKIEHMR